MFSNLSTKTPDSVTHYPITDSNLPFADYIEQCQAIIQKRREDLQKHPANASVILEANSPFEYYPANNAPIKAGVLLTHGLLDCPFTLREIGAHLQQQGLLTRAILLPGHGTRPTDLMHANYHQWLQAVRYGIETLKKEVDAIFLVGYSTGAALSIYHALHDQHINGIILLSPAIKLRTPIDVAANWVGLTNYLRKDRHWILNNEEDDYAKYRSIAYHGVKQVIKLTDTIRDLCQQQQLLQPMYMILSREDETISSKDAITFFSSIPQPASKMLLYTSQENGYEDKRIEVRKSIYPDLNIAHLAHASLPFSAENSHYGQHGDYINSSFHREGNYIDGAYNRIELNAFDLMNKYNLVEHPRRLLTYNPDFNNMMTNISEFIISNI